MFETDEQFIAVLLEKQRRHAKAKFEKLLERQGVDEETLSHIRQTHTMRDELCKKMEQTDDVDNLVNLAKQISSLEYVQQQLCGFPEDCSFHRWFDVPKCTCPKIYNRDAMGTPHQIISHNCPIHFSEILRKTCDNIENGE